MHGFQRLIEAKGCHDKNKTGIIREYVLGVNLSIVVPAHNEAENVGVFYSRLCTVMQQMDERSWELVFVNDGSSDKSLECLIELHRRDNRIHIIDLSRNFGKEAALSAGLDYATGQAVIPMDADLQDPPELIPSLVAKWHEGYDVVNACRESRDDDTWSKRVGAAMFYWLLNRVSEVSIPANVGDFRLVSRPALDALHKLPERRRFMKGLFAWVGFRTATVYYKRPPRYSGHSQWAFPGLLKLAIEGITSFGQIPLQLVSYTGLFISLLAFLYASYLIVTTLVFGNHVAGYPSIMVTMLFLGGIQLLGLGILGEYLGRIYEESKQRPLYLIRNTWGIRLGEDSPLTYIDRKKRTEHASQI